MQVAFQFKSQWLCESAIIRSQTEELFVFLTTLIASLSLQLIWSTWIWISTWSFQGVFIIMELCIMPFPLSHFRFLQLMLIELRHKLWLQLFSIVRSLLIQWRLEILWSWNEQIYNRWECQQENKEIQRFFCFFVQKRYWRHCLCY